jgi:hypothetical protein
MTRLPPIACLAALLALAACDGGARSPQQQADAQTVAACRRQADQTYDQQARGDIFRPASQVNTPFSGTYLGDNQQRGLSQLFIHDRAVSDCVRNTGTGADRTPPLPGTP